MFAPVNAVPSDIEQGVLLEGRRVDPSQPDELVLFESTAELLGVDSGETLDIKTLSPAQATALLEGGEFGGPPEGPDIAMHVVGIARMPRT